MLYFSYYVQELRAAAANIEPKHEKEIIALVNSYKKMFPRWVFELRFVFFLLHSKASKVQFMKIMP